MWREGGGRGENGVISAPTPHAPNDKGDVGLNDEINDERSLSA